MYGKFITSLHAIQVSADLSSWRFSACPKSQQHRCQCRLLWTWEHVITHIFKARSSSPSKSLICGDRQGLNTENDNISQTNFAIYKTPGFPRSHLLSTTCLPSSRLSYFHLSVPESSLAAKIAWSASGRSLVSNTFITMACFNSFYKTLLSCICVVWQTMQKMYLHTVHQYLAAHFVLGWRAFWKTMRFIFPLLPIAEVDSTETHLIFRFVMLFAQALEYSTEPRVDIKIYTFSFWVFRRNNIWLSQRNSSCNQILFLSSKNCSSHFNWVS